jgi:hypothetical protein
VVKDDVRVLKSVAHKEPVAKNAKALKRTGGATPQKAIVIGLSPKLPRSEQSAKKGLGKQSRRAADFLVKMRHQTFAPPMLPVGETAAMPPIARLVIWNDQRVSSGRLWRTFHVQSPSRLGKARLYLVSRQPVELCIPPSTHLLRKYSQIQGFITRMEAEPYDQIAGDCCDLILEVGQRMAIASRGALCKRFAKARCRSVLASDQPIA